MFTLVRLNWVYELKQPNMSAVDELSLIKRGRDAYPNARMRMHLRCSYRLLLRTGLP